MVAIPKSRFHASALVEEQPPKFRRSVTCCLSSTTKHDGLFPPLSFLLFLLKPVRASRKKLENYHASKTQRRRKVRRGWICPPTTAGATGHRIRSEIAWVSKRTKGNERDGLRRELVWGERVKRIVFPFFFHYMTRQFLSTWTTQRHHQIIQHICHVIKNTMVLGHSCFAPGSRVWGYQIRSFRIGG